MMLLISLLLYFLLSDYDAPLSEAGDITEKFKALKNVMKKYNPEALAPSKINQNKAGLNTINNSPTFQPIGLMMNQDKTSLNTLTF